MGIDKQKQITNLKIQYQQNWVKLSMKNCKFCISENIIKNGKPKGIQRYYCKDCNREQIAGDHRLVYSNEIKKAAIILYLEGNGLRRTARCLNQIFKSKISFQLISHWINYAGNIVKNEVAKRQYESSSNNKQDLVIVEMDELYTYIKKNLAKILQQESKRAITPEYGLLLIGTQAIYLNLK